MPPGQNTGSYTQIGLVLTHASPSRPGFQSDTPLAVQTEEALQHMMTNHPGGPDQLIVIMDTYGATGRLVRLPSSCLNCAC